MPSCQSLTPASFLSSCQDTRLWTLCTSACCGQSPTVSPSMQTLRQERSKDLRQMIRTTIKYQNFNTTRYKYLCVKNVFKFKVI
mmetsp:Transcript_25613/g.40511  ORF Transcript_25613/g.40511 Transcript_25613/m.40511 type:complete len:84 (+) Transcript_25613:3320-3571(+)